MGADKGASRFGNGECMISGRTEVQMSIVSGYEFDNSAALAKRFASLARGYFDNPSIAKDASAHVPLENLYRMLEMYRYDSFEDESRRGVLALQGLEATLSDLPGSSPWHAPIETALARAVNTAFGSVKKDEAIDQLEGSLRWLITGESGPDDATLQKAREFFETFEASI